MHGKLVTLSQIARESDFCTSWCTMWLFLPQPQHFPWKLRGGTYSFFCWPSALVLSDTAGNKIRSGTPEQNKRNRSTKAPHARSTVPHSQGCHNPVREPSTQTLNFCVTYRTRYVDDVHTEHGAILQLQ